jgi:hypothetical protein
MSSEPIPLRPGRVNLRAPFPGTADEASDNEASAA